VSSNGRISESELIKRRNRIRSKHTRENSLFSDMGIARLPDVSIEEQLK